MKYKIKENKSDLELEFYFDKTKTILYVFVSIVIVLLIIFNLKTSIMNNFGKISITIMILMYLSLVDLFEWFKHKKHIFKLEENKLYINDKYIIEKDRIYAVFIEYINSQIEGGWRIYLDNFMGNNRYMIKERLSKEDAIDIACQINKILSKKIILRKARGEEIIKCYGES